MTKISLEIDGRVLSMELPYNDATAEELIKGFCTLMHGQTFLICTIKDSLREAAQDYKEDIELGAKSYYDVDRVLQTLTCKASPENDKLQDELTAELGPDVVGKITERRFKSRFKRLVSPIIVPREMYD